MRHALEAADRRDWDAAQIQVREALSLGSTAVEDAGAAASVVRSTTAVLGVLALSAAHDGPDVSATAVPGAWPGGLTSRSARRTTARPPSTSR